MVVKTKGLAGVSPSLTLCLLDALPGTEFLSCLCRHNSSLSISHSHSHTQTYSALYFSSPEKRNHYTPSFPSQELQLPGVLPPSPVGPQIHPCLPSILVFLFPQLSLCLNQQFSTSITQGFFFFSKCRCFYSPFYSFIRGDNIFDQGRMCFATNQSLRSHSSIGFDLHYLLLGIPSSHASGPSTHHQNYLSASKSNLIISLSCLKIFSAQTSSVATMMKANLLGQTVFHHLVLTYPSNFISERTERIKHMVRVWTQTRDAIRDFGC